MMEMSTDGKILRSNFMRWLEYARFVYAFKLIMHAVLNRKSVLVP